MTETATTVTETTAQADQGAPHTIDTANAEVTQVMASGQPVLIDVVSAKSVIAELADEQTPTLLHAGPPVDFADMSETRKKAASAMSSG